MLMHANENPYFSTGGLLNCLEILPEYDSASFKKILRTRYPVSDRKYSEILNFQRVFKTNKTQPEEITQFAQAAVFSLLSHQFFCRNKLYFAACFFDELKNSLDIKNTVFIEHAKESRLEHLDKGKGQYIISLIECPNNAKMILPDKFDAEALSPEMELLADDDFAKLFASAEWQAEWNAQYEQLSEEDVMFWKKCYFCMFGLLREALSMQTNRGGTVDLINWTSEIALVNKVYLQYMQQIGTDITPMQLYYLYLKRQEVNDAKEFIESFYSANEQDKPRPTPSRILQDTFEGLKMDYTSLMTNLRLKERDTPYKQVSYLDPCGRHISLMFNDIILPQKNIVYNSDIFVIRNTKTRVDITGQHNGRVIKYIAAGYRLLLLHTAYTSAERTDYRPFSYRKVHIDTCKIKDKVPGEEHRFQYYIELSPIEFFDHLIVRNYLNNVYLLPDSFALEQDRNDYVRYAELTPAGFENTDAFYMMAGCGIWVVSSDNYLLISRRSNVYEKPVDLGYSAAGSCEYSSRLKTDSNVSEYEANPFLTARRELFEECAIDIPVEKLQLISFGIDFERYLQQFSFYHRSDLTADQLLERSKHSVSCNEQVHFAIPFTAENISRLIHEYEIEPGAVVSLIRLWEWLH